MLEFFFFFNVFFELRVLRASLIQNPFRLCLLVGSLDLVQYQVEKFGF